MSFEYSYLKSFICKSYSILLSESSIFILNPFSSANTDGILVVLLRGLLIDYIREELR